MTLRILLGAPAYVIVLAVAYVIVLACILWELVVRLAGEDEEEDE